MPLYHGWIPTHVPGDILRCLPYEVDVPTLDDTFPAIWDAATAAGKNPVRCAYNVREGAIVPLGEPHDPGIEALLIG